MTKSIKEVTKSGKEVTKTPLTTFSQPKSKIDQFKDTSFSHSFTYLQPSIKIDSSQPSNCQVPHPTNSNKLTRKMSIASDSSSYDQALALVSELPFADKLRFNAELASLLKKEGKSGAVGKAAKKQKKAKDPDAPKKAASLGTQAWFAFVKHCKSEFADRFEDCTKEPERLTVCKTIKSEDEEAYNAFVAKFKEEHPSDNESDSEPEAAPAPLTPKEKLEKAKALAAAAKKPEEKPKAASTPKKVEEKPKAAPKEEKPKAPKKEVKKAAPKKEVKKEEEEIRMPKKEIDGTEYWFDPETNGLYTIQDGGFGAWVGFFQPDNEDEPIRLTESPADE